MTSGFELIISCTWQGSLYHCTKNVHATWCFYTVSVHDASTRYLVSTRYLAWTSPPGWCPTSCAGTAASASVACHDCDFAGQGRPMALATGTGTQGWLCQASCQCHACCRPVPMHYIQVITQVQTQTIHLLFDSIRPVAQLKLWAGWSMKTFHVQQLKPFTKRFFDARECRPSHKLSFLEMYYKFCCRCFGLLYSEWLSILGGFFQFIHLLDVEICTINSSIILVHTFAHNH